MKKLLKLICVFAMVLTCTTVVLAEEHKSTFQISVDNTSELEAGDQVIVDVDLTQSTGLSVATLQLFYDQSIFTLLGIEDMELFTEIAFNGKEKPILNITSEPQLGLVDETTGKDYIFIDMEIPESIKASTTPSGGTGTLARVYLQVNENVSVKNTTISIVGVDVAVDNEIDPSKPISCEIGDGNSIDLTFKVEITDPEYTKPEAKTGLVYNGSNQELISAGTIAEDQGTLKYASVTAGSTKPAVSAFTTAIPTAKDAGSYDVYYLVEGGEGHYDVAATKLGTVTIDKAVPKYTVPEITYKPTYGDKLKTITLDDGWTWNDPEALVGNAGTASAKATFTPSDTKNYVTVEKDLTYEVLQAMPEYTEPSNLRAYYGQTLGNVKLPDGWTWKAGNATSVGDVDLDGKDFVVVFTPEDELNYKKVEVTVKLIVDKTEPVYTAPELSEHTTYNGEAYAVLTAGSTQHGAFEYAVAAKGETPDEYSTTVPTVTNAGEYDVYYRVNGDSNHGSVGPVKLGTLTVKKATPAYDLPEITYKPTYGDKLKTITLDDGWTWNDPEALVGNAGTASAKATFTPSDTKNYVTVEKTLTYTVLKADAAYTEPVLAKDTTYTGKAYSVLSAGVTEDGIFQYSVVEKGGELIEFSASVPTVTDAGEYDVWYKVLGDNNHNDVVGKKLGTITVSKANPKYDLPVIEKAPTYGDKLDSIELPDGWKWNDPTALVGNAGTASAKATFTPSDTKNYNTVTETIEYTVLKANLKYTAPEIAAGTVYSGKEYPVIKAVGECENGTFQYGLSSTALGTEVPKVTDAGKYDVYYKVIPADPDNYNTVEAILLGTLTVNKAKLTLVYSEEYSGKCPVKSDSKVSSIVVSNYVKAKSDLVESVSGEFQICIPDTSIVVSKLDSYKLPIRFVPNNTNYETVDGELILSVTTPVAGYDVVLEPMNTDGVDSDAISNVENDPTVSTLTSTIKTAAEKSANGDKLSSLESAVLDAAQTGKTISTVLKSDALELEDVSSALKNKVPNNAKGNFFDISLYLVVNNNVATDEDGKDIKITNLEGSIEFKIDLPELPPVESGYKREFHVLKEHGNDIKPLSGVRVYSGQLTFSTTEFSSFVWYYNDVRTTGDWIYIPSNNNKPVVNTSAK